MQVFLWLSSTETLSRAALNSGSHLFMSLCHQYYIKSVQKVGVEMVLVVFIFAALSLV